MTNELKQIRDVLTDCKQEFWDDWHSHISEGDFENHWLIMDIDKALATIDRLIAEQGWQPIETAPKDGTVFDVYTKYGRVTNCVACKQFGRIYSYNQESDNYDRKVNFATHWMPLPQPPTMQGE